MDDVCWDNGKHDTDEEAGRGKRNAEREAALTFVRMAKEKGLDLTGPDGLPKQFTKSVLETALDEEMTEHLGRAKHKKSRTAGPRTRATAPPPRPWSPIR